MLNVIINKLSFNCKELILD